MRESGEEPEPGGALKGMGIVYINDEGWVPTPSTERWRGATGQVKIKGKVSNER